MLIKMSQCTLPSTHKEVNTSLEKTLECDFLSHRGGIPACTNPLLSRTPRGHALGCFDSPGKRCWDQECSSKSCHVQTVMEYVCWRLMLFLIIRLPGAAWRTVCMKPNRFQVSPPKVLMSQHTQSLLADGYHTPSVCEAARSQHGASPLHSCSLQHCLFGSAAFCDILKVSTNWEHFLLLFSLRTVPRTPSGAGFPGPGRLMGSGRGPFGGVGGSTLLRSQSSGEHAVL